MNSPELWKVEAAAAEKQLHSVMRHVKNAYHDLEYTLAKENSREEDIRNVAQRVSFILEATIRYYNKGKARAPYFKNGARQNVFHKKFHNRGA